MDYQNGILDMLDEPDDAALARRATRSPPSARAGGTIGYVRVAFEDADLDGDPRRPAGWARASAPRPARSTPTRRRPRSTSASRRRTGDIVVRKTRVGAFSTTDLDEQLRERGIDTLILAGISTSGVVLSTVRDATDRDYRVFVLADASADPEPDVHAFLTERIFPRQADVITVAELEGLLSGDG